MATPSCGEPKVNQNYLAAIVSQPDFLTVICHKLEVFEYVRSLGPCLEKGPPRSLRSGQTLSLQKQEREGGGNRGSTDWAGGGTDPRLRRTQT